MKRNKTHIDKRESILFHLYISPWLIGFLAFTLFPMILSLYMTFTDGALGKPWTFVGLENYKTIFTKDDLFWVSLWNTIYYTFVSVPLSIAFAYFLACLLNAKLRGIAFFRAIFYLPSVVAGVAMVLLWGWIFNPSFGLLNYFLGIFGITGPDWLGNPSLAMPAIIFMSLWGVGGTMVIFLASLQDIPQHLYESAQIDGAGWWVKVTRITIPLTTPVIFFNLVLGFINGFQVFSQSFILTLGGPLNATYVYMLHLYRNAFQYGKMAYGSALAWILFIIIMAFTLILNYSSKRWVYYEGGDK